jgi:hypothetical protein
VTYKNVEKHIWNTQTWLKLYQNTRIPSKLDFHIINRCIPAKNPGAYNFVKFWIEEVLEGKSILSQIKKKLKFFFSKHKTKHNNVCEPYSTIEKFNLTVKYKIEPLQILG